MRYRMQHRLAARSFAGGQHFVIQDDNSTDRFVADGSLFTGRNTLVLRNMEGHELLYIHYHLGEEGRRYHMLRDGTRIAEMEQHYDLRRERFTVHCSDSDDLEVRGDWANHEYTFSRDGKAIARVSKRWFTFHEMYGVEIEPQQDDVLILGCALVIDLINDR